MASLTGENVLSLVHQALTEFDDRPLDVTIRRAARIASLLGETELAVRFTMELKAHGGHPQSNAENAQRMMADPSAWGSPDGPDFAAMRAWSENRTFKDGPHAGNVSTFGVAEIIAWLDEFDERRADGDDRFVRLHYRAVLERIRQRVFTALCAWERQLTYANVNERIFDRFRSRVDAMLAQGASALVAQFSAVYRRLREATRDPQSPVAEELAQAVTTCRRILKTVADHVLPAAPGAVAENGSPLNDSAYRNRIFQFVKDNVGSEAVAGAVKAAIGGVYERFSTLDKLANKGVHAELGVKEAEMCAIHTYLVAGELLDLFIASSNEVTPAHP
ncbi:hypothetical protein [Saccharothrix syringae]|uniref:AbiTii domain-containing protein n=1 Tax=Saccharothrix syringae TaxID=103733 RepID=A0A5Q0H2M3_SACSY|nr:hypothetical protein [Saccharothrix syringae]QFZ20363.1 hypothetical protein EKG83_25720 [Saccharothrix syringae]